MKNIIIPSAVLIAAAISFAACTKQAALEPVIEKAVPTRTEKETYNLKINLSLGNSVRTKALQEGNLETINDLQILVFDATRSDSIETHFCSTKLTDSLRLTAGKKKIRVLVNTPLVGGIEKLSDLEKSITEYACGNMNKFQMAGEAEMDLTMDSSVDIVVNRLVAKVVLKQVTKHFDAFPYNDEEFHLNDIFLNNITYYTMMLGGEYTGWQQSWRNGLEWERSSDQGLNVGLTFDDEPSYWDYEECEIIYNVEHIFYCFPNSNPDHPTRLVLKTEFDGRTFYYPIDLGPIEQNKVYTIKDIRITRLGSDDPDTPVDSQMLPYKITIGDWDEEEIEIQEII